jgi:hypothetical protein
VLDMPSHRYGAQLGAPAVPAGTTPQLPSLPARLQALHAPPHADDQQ